MSRIATSRRAARIVGSLGREADEHARNLHSYAVIIMSAAVAAVIVMWVFNCFVTYGRVVVFPIAIVGILATVYVSLHPKFIFWAAGLGALVEGLNDRDITQGVGVGLKVYFRAVSGAIFFFTASAVVLAIIPFENAPSVFWGFALIIVAVSTMFAYLNISTGKWKVRIVVTASIVLCVLLAMQLLVPNGVRLWAESNYNALDRAAERRAAEIEFCSQNPNHQSCQSVVVRLAAQPQPGGKTLNHQFRTLVTRHWQDVDILPGTCVEADDIDDLLVWNVRKDLTKIKSRSDEDVYVFLTWKRSGTCS